MDKDKWPALVEKKGITEVPKETDVHENTVKDETETQIMEEEPAGGGGDQGWITSAPKCRRRRIDTQRWL